MKFHDSHPAPPNRRYDVVVAGARAAGASTAMLLARAGLRVLVVDPTPKGRDTLSTHALMRGGVFQLHRWGILDGLRAQGTPAIEDTTFDYGDERVTIPIKSRDGVDALFAPRRTVLDPLLVDAAIEAGAEFAFGFSVANLVHDAAGRVRGAWIVGRDGTAHQVDSEWVIGADGVRSKVARLVGAEALHVARHATASIYGYWDGLGGTGYRWYFREDSSMGLIPTNGGQACVFVSVRPDVFRRLRHGGLDTLYHRTLGSIDRALGDELAGGAPARLRAFPGIPGFLRRSAGPGWALVGDAGYFKDPLTAHGITDALRDAELLARAVARGADSDVLEYQAVRDDVGRGLMEVTDRIASLEWDLDEVKDLHKRLAREMNAGVELIRGWAPVPGFAKQGAAQARSAS